MATIQTPSKIKLISDALVLIGEKPASSLSEDRYGVTVGANLFEQIYENELQSNRWRFAMRKNSLSRLSSTPLNEWTYAYQLPSDCLLLIGTYPVIQYEIYGDNLYTDAQAVEAEYLFKPDITEIPAYFAHLMVYALARDMIKPITESDTGVQVMQAKYVMQRDRAMYADAQARPARRVQRSPFMDVR